MLPASNREFGGDELSRQEQFQEDAAAFLQGFDARAGARREEVSQISQQRLRSTQVEDRVAEVQSNLRGAPAPENAAAVADAAGALMQAVGGSTEALWGALGPEDAPAVAPEPKPAVATPEPMDIAEAPELRARDVPTDQLPRVRDALLQPVDAQGRQMLGEARMPPGDVKTVVGSNRTTAASFPSVDWADPAAGEELLVWLVACRSGFRTATMAPAGATAAKVEATVVKQLRDGTATHGERNGCGPLRNGSSGILCFDDYGHYKRGGYVTKETAAELRTDPATNGWTDIFSEDLTDDMHVLSVTGAMWAALQLVVSSSVENQDGGPVCGL